MSFILKSLRIGPHGVTLWQMMVLISAGALTGLFWASTNCCAGSGFPWHFLTSALLFVLVVLWEGAFDRLVFGNLYAAADRRHFSLGVNTIATLSYLAPLLWLVFFAICIVKGFK